MPGGSTIAHAYAKIKEEMPNYGSSKIKFKITKVTETEEDMEELTGSDLTALILKLEPV